MKPLTTHPRAERWVRTRGAVMVGARDAWGRFTPGLRWRFALLVATGAAIAAVCLSQGWGPARTVAGSVPVQAPEPTTPPASPPTAQASPAPASPAIRAPAEHVPPRSGELIVAGDPLHAGSNAPMSVDGPPAGGDAGAGGADASSRVFPAQAIRLPLPARPVTAKNATTHSVAGPPTAATTILSVPPVEAAPRAASALAPAADAESQAADPADSEAKAAFTAFVERLVPRLAAEVAAKPLDMWTQRYSPQVRSLEVSRTQNPVYPYSGFFSLEKRWTSAIRAGERSYDSSATTLDTLVFLFRDGRWEFTSGRATGQMKIRVPGADAIVNPVDSELSGDERIRRATQAANGDAPVARAAKR